MVTLTNLPGIRRKTVQAFGVTSRSAAIKHLRQGKIVTAAGSSGALNVWLDDDGNYRCEFDRFLVPQSKLTTKYLATVDAWLKEWFPQLGR